MVGVGLIEPLIQFALVTALAKSYASKYQAALSARTKSPWAETKRPWLLVATTFVLLPILGGFCNRIRGGWRPLGHTNMGNTLGRMVMACGVAGVAKGVGGVSRTLAIFTVVTTFVGMLIGWGCYMSMGRPLQSEPLPEGAHTDCIDLSDRYGCFDLFIGVAQLDWTGARRWRRDMAGMSLRGILWMLPVGVGYWSAGYGSLLLRAGMCMGLVYELGNDLSLPHFPFGSGTPLSEFLMGNFWFLVVGASVLGKRQEPDDEASSSSSSSSSLYASLLEQAAAGAAGEEEDGTAKAPQKVQGGEARMADSRHHLLAKAFCRMAYDGFDALSWVCTFGIAVLTVADAIENHPIEWSSASPPPSG